MLGIVNGYIKSTNWCAPWNTIREYLFRLTLVGSALLSYNVEMTLLLDARAVVCGYGEE